MTGIKFYFFCFAFLSVSTSLAQNISLQDYQRAQSFLWENVSNKSAFNLYFDGDFFADSTGLWYKDYGPEQKDYYVLTFDNGQPVRAFDQSRLADSLSILLDDTISSYRLPVQNIISQEDGQMEIEIKGTVYSLNLSNYSVYKKDIPEEEESKPTESKSPDGKWTAFIEDYNLFVRSNETDSVYQLSDDGYKDFEYGSYVGWADLIEGENGSRKPRVSVDWSPDSKWIQTDIADFRRARKMHLLDYSVDTLFRPNVLSYYRGSPGDTTMVHLIPKFYNMVSLQEVPISLPRRTHINSPGYWWFENKNQVLIVDAERGYKKYHYQLLNLDNARIKQLFSLSSDTRMHRGYGIRLFEKHNRFIYISQETGWRQIHCYNFDSGESEQLTNGRFVVHDIVQIDKDTGVIYFTASGINQDENPYNRHLYRISLDGSDQEDLTPEVGNHDIQFSPNGQYFLDVYSTNSLPTQFRLKSNSGEILANLIHTKVDSLVERGWNPGEQFTAIARDGETVIYGAYWKPTFFSPDNKYPVIDHSYTGPHTNVFPRSFQRNFWEGHQDIAELGFIVVRIDGMGTYGRSKEFHDVSYKNMGQNLLDHVLAIRQLGQQYSWVDTTRVGIFGHSAGGYDAGHAVLAFPDFYKVAVASSADHDFRMEKAWWPEMYQGWPVDSTYHEVSNITMAGNLQGKLLITHGGLDENVNPSATFKLAEALIRADKDFDMLILPSQHHGYGGSHRIYFRKKRWNYFVEHLLGADPIWDIE